MQQFRLTESQRDIHVVSAGGGQERQDTPPGTRVNLNLYGGKFYTPRERELPAIWRWGEKEKKGNWIKESFYLVIEIKIFKIIHN